MRMGPARSSPSRISGRTASRCWSGRRIRRRLRSRTRRSRSASGRERPHPPTRCAARISAAPTSSPARRGGDVALILYSISPFFHVVGLHGILNLGLFAGATIATIVRYDLRTFLGAVQEYRINSAFLTPPVVNDLTRNPIVDEYDLSSLRSILCAAAPLGPEAEAAASERLGCGVR